jgi:CRISPR/Cas system-associated endonuclease/helicase Cas3
MIIPASVPEFSSEEIPHFPHKSAFKHQFQFYEAHSNDMIFKSPTASGKTEAFVFSYVDDYLNSEQRLKSLYLVPTRLLMYSQLDNLVAYLKDFNIPNKVLESNYSFAELFKHLWENDFIISSPDIIFYILLRRKNTQHIKFQYDAFVRALHSIIFDEVHLFDTYTLFNIKNLVKILKCIKPSVHLYLLSATIDLKDIINPADYTIIGGTSFTKRVVVTGQSLDYLNSAAVIKYLEGEGFTNNTVYVCNSVDRALRLHKHFQGSACLVGKTWYEEGALTRDEQIKDNLAKCKEGALTFSTSVFRQGVDIPIKRLITEQPLNLQDAIQTFGRCGRHEESYFTILTSKRPMLDALNAPAEKSRQEFEGLLARFFRPAEYEKMKRMMNAMWYKLYNRTKLKQQVEPLLTPEMRKDFEDFEEFLPDLSFREPMPSIKYGDLAVNLFDVLQFKDAYLNLFPSDDSFTIGELRDGGRFTRREYKRSKSSELPSFTLTQATRFEDTEYFTLQLKLRDLAFKLSAILGDFGQYRYALVDKRTLIPRQRSFEPRAFFE